MPSRNGLAAAATIAMLWSGAAQAQVAPAAQATPAAGSTAAQPGAVTLDETPVLALPTVEVIGTSPLPGIGIDPDRLPNATYSFSAGELLREGPRELPRAMRDRLGGVTTNDAQNNPFQPDLQYRGFVASPLTGTPQGLAVYQNGVRINEVLGDTVNWDVIPDRAINRVNIISANPVYGLNALGGAVVLEMKNGFNFQGGEVELSGGSFGRVSLEGEYGVQAGNFASYIAASGINDAGWRDFSPSRVRRLYADLGARLPADSRSEIHLSFTGADNSLTGNGATPVQLLENRRESIFTYPDQTTNKVAMLNLNGTYAPSETASVQGLAYYRELRQHTVNGDILEAEACDPKANPGRLCLGNDDGPVLLNQSGSPVANFLGNSIPGAFNRTATASTGAGGSAQLTETARVFDHPNNLVIGASYDHGNADFSASTEIGSLTPDRTVAGTGEIVTSADGTVAPVRFTSQTDYYGIYATDTFDLTPALAVTAGGRFNAAQIRLSDQLGTSLNGSHSFSRFNPAIGATYKIAPAVTAYAGYSEGNRAPTPVELGCADAARPCALANFFVADPPLKQVVTHSYETGLRGGLNPSEAARLTWNAGVFRTDAADDIIFVASAIRGRGFFQNAGTTRSQGIESGVSYRDERWSIYAQYAFVDATFRNALTLPSPNNPFAAEDGTIAVKPGDQRPGVPNHRLRVGADYEVLPKWTIGATLVYTGRQFLRGDEANLTAPIPDYWVVNLHTNYRIAQNVELFARVDNLFNQKYATFGTFTNVAGLTFGNVALTDPRSLSPAPPIAAFAGLRLIF